MDEATKKQYSDEAHQLINERVEYVKQYYPRMRDAYQEPYGFSNLDPIRHEASIAIIFGLFQAGITLTNHLLEALMKIAIISKISADSVSEEADFKGDLVDSFIEKHKPSQDKYGSANLHNNINKVHALGLIDDDQKDLLHSFREQFRNAYGHADKAKTFGDSTMPVQGVRMHPDGMELQDRKEVKIADLIIGQGMAQAEIAKRTAPEYFLAIDEVTRQILGRLFGDQLNPGSDDPDPNDGQNS